MRFEKFPAKLIAAATLALAILGTTARSTAQQESILHSFSNSGTDGVAPYDRLTFDAEGNLYGTTFAGGSYNGGTVFKLSPQAGGSWTETILHNFGNGTDAQGIYAGVVLDATGNIFGMSYNGGAYGEGSVFEVSPKTGGGYSERVLHSFNVNGVDGFEVFAGVILDSAGNLYGTTAAGGAYNDGTVFELVKSGGGYREKIIHNFNYNGRDGVGPQGGLIFDSAGSLYSTTSQGGIYNSGTVFELSPHSGGWSIKILHSFDSKTGDATNPVAGVTFDALGNMYGTANGGAYGHGAVFEMQPASGGGWTESVIHSFADTTSDGASPSGVVTIDASGNLYGVTGGGGAYNYWGTAYEFVLSGGGWTENVLYSFGNGTDGRFPNGGVIFDSSGNMYGTTVEGGSTDCGGEGCGTVYEITP
jgi:uncharacterized repeat protein (TIGR03803 family)